jgi:hypothetical protein
MPGMLNLCDILQLVIDRLYDCPFSKQQFVGDGKNLLSRRHSHSCFPALNQREFFQTIYRNPPINTIPLRREQSGARAVIVHRRFVEPSGNLTRKERLSLSVLNRVETPHCDVSTGR